MKRMGFNAAKSGNTGGSLTYILLLIGIISLVVIYYAIQPAEKDGAPQPELSAPQLSEVEPAPAAPEELEIPGESAEVEPKPQPTPPTKVSKEEKREKFKQMMKKKNYVFHKGAQKWVRKEDVPRVEQKLAKKRVAKKGLVEHNGRWVTPKDKELLTFQEQMRRKGLKWSHDRWIPVDEMHPWEVFILAEGGEGRSWSKKGTKSDTELPESPKTTLPEPEPELPLTPRISEGGIELELAEVKPIHRRDGTKVLVRGKTNLPTKTTLYAEVKNGLSQASQITSDYIPVKIGKSFRGELDIIQGRLPKGFYQVVLSFNKVLQDPVLERKLKDVPDRLRVSKSFNVGSLDEIRELVEQDKTELTQHLKSLAQFYQEVEEQYQQTLENQDEPGYKQWSKGWTRRLNQSYKKIEKHSVVLSRFPDTLSEFRKLKGILLMLNRKHQFLLAGEKIPHSLGKKYIPETFSGVFSDVQRAFSTESEKWERLLKPEEESQE